MRRLITRKMRFSLMDIPMLNGAWMEPWKMKKAGMVELKAQKVYIKTKQMMFYI